MAAESPEIAMAICEEWADGDLSMTSIIKKLKADGHTINTPDVRWWCQYDHKVEICGKTYTLDALLRKLFMYRFFDQLNGVLEMCLKGEKGGRLPAHIRNEINVRMWQVEQMRPKDFDATVIDKDLGFIVPYNPLFDKASNDAEPN